MYRHISVCVETFAGWFALAYVVASGGINAAYGWIFSIFVVPAQIIILLFSAFGKQHPAATGVLSICNAIFIGIALGCGLTVLQYRDDTLVWLLAILYTAAPGIVVLPLLRANTPQGELGHAKSVLEAALACFVGLNSFGALDDNGQDLASTQAVATMAQYSGLSLATVAYCVLVTETYEVKPPTLRGVLFGVERWLVLLHVSLCLYAVLAADGINKIETGLLRALLPLLTALTFVPSDVGSGL